MGGGGGGDAPNYAPLAAAQRDATSASQQIAAMQEYNASVAANQQAYYASYASNQQSYMASRQLDFAENVYRDQKPFFEKIANAQIAAMELANQQGKESWQYWKSTYQPIEQELARQAVEFNTPAYQEQLAQQAAADSGIAFGTTKAANDRAMAAMGVNPNSGRFQTTQRGSDMAQAATRAAMMTGTRQQAQATGYARQADAVNIGKGLPSQSLQAMGVGVNAGTAAGNSMQAPSLAMQQGMAQAANTQTAGNQFLLQGMTNSSNTLMNGLNQAYNTRLAALNYGIDAGRSYSAGLNPTGYGQGNQWAGAAIGGLSGAKAGAAVGGMVAGASQGAAAGSVIPIWGTAIGGLLGAIGGYFGSRG